MVKSLVIFGTGSFAAMVRYHVEQAGCFDVIAHTVDGQYLTQDRFEDQPVFSFEELPAHIPPGTAAIIFPIGWTNSNRLRADRCRRAMDAGYEVAGFVSPQCYAWAGIRYGYNVLLSEGVVIQPYATLGDNVLIRTGSIIGHHATVGNHCFIASGVITGGNVSIGDHSSIGLGAIIRDNVTIAPYTFIGAGAVVISDTEPYGVYVGSPARKLENRSSLDIK